MVLGDWEGEGLGGRRGRVYCVTRRMGGGWGCVSCHSDEGRLVGIGQHSLGKTSQPLRADMKGWLTPDASVVASGIYDTGSLTDGRMDGWKEGRME